MPINFVCTGCGAVVHATASAAGVPNYCPRCAAGCQPAVAGAEAVGEPVQQHPRLDEVEFGDELPLVLWLLQASHAAVEVGPKRSCALCSREPQPHLRLRGSHRHV